MPTSSAFVMPTGAERYAVDTSVAVAALDAGHAAHLVCRQAVQRWRPALAGHAAFETYAVLTRLPGGQRVDGPTASELMARVFPEVLALDTAASQALLGRLGPVGIVGGAVYDALVGSAALGSGCRLLTRDGRARRTYELLGVDFQVVE